MSTEKDLDALLRHFIDRGVPGAALAVYRGEEPLYEAYHSSLENSH